MYVRPQEHTCENMHAQTKLEHAENIFLNFCKLSCNLHQILERLNTHCGGNEIANAYERAAMSQHLV